MKKNFILGLFTVLLTLIFSACNVNISHNLGMNRVEESSEKTIDGGSITSLNVSVPVGKIQISSWDKSDVYVKAVKRNNGFKEKQELTEELKNIELQYNQDGSKLAVKVFLPKLKDNGLSVDLDISVPKGMTVYNVQNEVGDIQFSGLSGQIDTVSGVGKIGVDSCSGTINLKVSTGDMTIERSSLKGNCTITSSTGRLLFNGSIDPQGTYNMTTNVGMLDITLPSGTAFDVDASTSVGDINCGFQVSGEMKKTKVNGKVNGGGPKLTIVNNVGGVKISSR